MANAPVSFDSIIQEGRKKRKAEQLAAEIFSKNRRSSAPPSAPKIGLGGSLASRVGVTKRPSSLTRSASTTPHQPGRPAHLSRPPPAEPVRPRPSYTQSFSGALNEAKSNGAADDSVNGGNAGISFKGAASGPYVIVAQNFAPGTTAADIESVMQGVGGDMTNCKLVASTPTVIAEMVFVERSGAEKVIETFNGKKADGRPLYVFWKAGSGHSDRGMSIQGNTGRSTPRNSVPQPEPEAPALGAGQTEDVAMDVDENAESREAQDRLREERRGRDDRGRDDRGPREVFPTGPRMNRGREDGYYRESDRRGGYDDGRYGYGGRGGGYRDDGRGRYGPGRDMRYGNGRGHPWRS